MPYSQEERDMKTLLILACLLLAAGYVVTHYFGDGGPKMTSNAKVAEDIATSH
jgi:hypothetical protein